MTRVARRIKHYLERLSWGGHPGKLGEDDLLDEATAILTVLSTRYGDPRTDAFYAANRALEEINQIRLMRTNPEPVSRWRMRS